MHETCRPVQATLLSFAERLSFPMLSYAYVQHMHARLLHPDFGTPGPFASQGLIGNRATDSHTFKAREAGS